MSLFGDELRRLRRRAGLSQESLAARAGLSPEAVSLLERGRRSPRLTTMRLLAEAMDLNDVDRPALFATAQLAADVATSLPIFPDPLIGRTAEVAALAELVERGDTRLVTVLGPAGVGKTRIAVAYAAGAAPRFADGVHWLAVGTLNEPETVLTALAAALGVRSAPGSLEQIVDHLRSQASLVMIDNAEHQLAGCTEVVQALLTGAPRLKMIMISRHALGLPVEQTLSVVPLEVPATGTAAAQLPNLPASRLFLTRAGTTEDLDEEQAAAVVRICQRVDGLPLALEIAAARTSVHTLPELADTLDAELGILQTVGPEGEVQLAEALVGWSYQWLSPQEKTIFAQLSVFRGGFGREAVAAVCGDGLGYVGSVGVLTSLVAKSLVARRDDGSPQARFRLLQLIRSFAEEQLLDQPYAAETHRRHAEYFRAVVQEAAPHLTGHDQREWLAVIDRELGNIRRAIAWSTEQQPEIAYQILAAVGRWCYLRGRYADGRRWAADVLQAWPEAPTSLRAPVLQLAGTLAFYQCDYAESTRMVEQAYELYARDCDDAGLVWCTSRLGAIAREQGEYERSESRHTEARQRAERAGNDHEVAVQLNYLSFLGWLRGDWRAAEPLGRQALDRMRTAGDREGVIWALINLGVCARYRGDLPAAQLLLQQTLDLATEMSFREGVAWATNQLGVLARLRGELDQALRLQQESLSEHRALGDRWRTASVLDELAAIAIARQDAAAAVQQLAAADRLRVEIHAPVPACERPDYEETVRLTRAALGPAYDVATLTAGLDSLAHD